MALCVCWPLAGLKEGTQKRSAALKSGSPNLFLLQGDMLKDLNNYCLCSRLRLSAGRSVSNIISMIIACACLACFNACTMSLLIDPIRWHMVQCCPTISVLAQAPGDYLLLPMQTRAEVALLPDSRTLGGTSQTMPAFYMECPTSLPDGGAFKCLPAQ